MRSAAAVALLALLALVALAATAAAVDHGPPKTAALLARGRDAYLSHCARCHGQAGAGDGPDAAALSPRPRNLVADPFRNGATPAQIFTTIGSGLHGTRMPPFAFLSDEERWAIAHLVAGLRAAAPSPTPHWALRVGARPPRPLDGGVRAPSR